MPDRHHAVLDGRLMHVRYCRKCDAYVGWGKPHEARVSLGADQNPIIEVCVCLPRCTCGLAA